MGLTNEEVIVRFKDGLSNRRRGGAIRWESSSGSVYCNGDVLYSYGSHFPLAVRLADGKFLKNGDTYSNTTSQHQGIVQQHLDGPTTSFSALRAAGVAPTCITADEILDTIKDVRRTLYRRDGKFFVSDWNGTEKGYREVATPSQGMFVPGAENDDGYVIGVWHVLGGILIEWDDRCLLAALDEDSYFCAELPAMVSTVAEAFDLLKPLAVHRAEEQGIEVLRQGEWFFVPTDLTDRDVADLLGYKTLKAFRASLEVEPLPTRPMQTNFHACKWVWASGWTLANGLVRHVDRLGTATGEHRAARLGNAWHYVWRNNEVRSWSVGGRFD